MTKSFIAKPIIKNQYWVITDGSEKVGNVLANSVGYELKINGTTTTFTDTKTIQKNLPIEFENPKNSKVHVPLYAQWPTVGKTYNNVLDIKRKLHIYTKTQKSKCYYAAGYFAMCDGLNWRVEFNPKYIFIQRQQYYGPFHTSLEARESINQINQINTV